MPDCAVLPQWTYESEIAAEKLVSLGYTNIWNLKGGMVDWEQAGFDLKNSPRE